METYPCGVIDLHLSQKFPVNAEIAEPPSLIVYDTVAFTRDRNQTREQAVLGSLEGSQQIASDRVDEARAFCRTQEEVRGQRHGDDKSHASSPNPTNHSWGHTLRFVERR